MKTKIVYILVSRPSDYYYEMLRLSLYSLRKHRPDVIVELVLGSDTHQRLLTEEPSILDVVKPLVVDIPQEYDVMQRSRYLKTRLRSLIDEDFLYLDCDTLVCDTFDEIDDFNADIAMVANGNGKLCSKDYFNSIPCEKAGFRKLKGQPYFNGGVFYAKDTPLAHQFFDKWHKLWMQSLNNGVPQDQPALCQVNMELEHPIHELSGFWNCQISYADAFPFISKAKIMHYYTDNGIVRSMIFEHLKKVNHPDTFIGSLINHPRLMGYLFLSMSDERLKHYVSSDMFFLNEKNPPLYKILVSLSHILNNPIIIGSKIKKSIFG